MVVVDFLKDLFNWHSGPPPFPENADGMRKSVTAAEAAAIFDTLASDKNIAFRYGYDGCYARAHIMCRDLFAMNIVPKKAWALEDNELLVVRLGKQKLEWSFHVAPVVTVEFPDGKNQDMVFDPSLFDGPVTLKQWAHVMHADNKQVEIQAVGKPPFDMPGDYTTDEKTGKRTDKKARRTMEDYMPLQEPEGSVKLFESGFEALAGQTAKPQKIHHKQLQAA